MSRASTKLNPDKGLLQGVPIETKDDLEGPGITNEEGFDKIPHSLVAGKNTQVPDQEEEADGRGRESCEECQSRG